MICHGTSRIYVLSQSTHSLEIFNMHAAKSFACKIINEYGSMQNGDETDKMKNNKQILSKQNFSTKREQMMVAFQRFSNILLQYQYDIWKHANNLNAPHANSWFMFHFTYSIIFSCWHFANNKLSTISHRVVECDACQP